MKLTAKSMDRVAKLIQADLGYQLDHIDHFQGALPGALQYSTTAFQATINNEIVVFISLFEESSATADRISIWNYKLQESVSNKFVLIFQNIDRNQQIALMQNHMPFLTLAGDFYLPFLSIKLLSVKSSTPMPEIKRHQRLSRNASSLLTVLIYASAGLSAEPNNSETRVFENGGYLFHGGKQLEAYYAKMAGIRSKPTLNRTLNELESAGIISSSGSRAHRMYGLNRIGGELFFQHHTEMVSPIVGSISLPEDTLIALLKQKQAIDVRHLEELDGITLSGISAISAVTEVMPDDNQFVLAFESSLFKETFDAMSKSTIRDLIAHGMGNGRSITVQHWRTDPEKIGNWLRQHGIWTIAQNVPDPISLYLANDEPYSERITGALEDIIENLTGDLNHG